MGSSSLRGMLHPDPFQKGGEIPGGAIAGNWGGIFDPVAAADFPALVRLAWPCCVSWVKGEHLLC